MALGLISRMRVGFVGNSIIGQKSGTTKTRRNEGAKWSWILRHRFVTSYRHGSFLLPAPVSHRAHSLDTEPASPPACIAGARACSGAIVAILHRARSNVALRRHRSARGSIRWFRHDG